MAEAASSGAEEETVHDLRTGIRRLSECLRTFDRVFPGSGAGRVRRKLRKLMDLAAEVRNRDISAALFRKAGVSERDPAFARLQAESQTCKKALLERLEKWNSKNRGERWRRMLE